MEIAIISALKALFLPPGISVLLALLALLSVWRWQRFARGCVVLSLLLLTVFSLPVVSNLLTHSLQSAEPLPPETEVGDFWQAIVVLGGGHYGTSPEYGTDIPNYRTLERLRYAARLYKRTGLPLVLSGGRVHGEGPSEAELMSETLENDFGVKARWLETESRNTAENAANTHTLLAAHRIERVLLVTHSLHMRRAAAAFSARGLAVQPAPTIGAGAENPDGITWREFLPRAWAIAASRDALHEHIGYLWYRLRY